MTLRATASLWTDTAPPTAHPALAEDLEVDVAVVGGGLAGVTTALWCKRDGARVAVLERGVVAGGATGMSTAKASALQESVLARVRGVAGDDALRAYAAANAAAIERMEALVREHGIDCAWERLADHTYAADEGQVATVEQVVDAGRAAGLPVELVDGAPVPFDVPAAARLDGQAQFQPASYTRALADLVAGDGSHVFESTMVRGLSEGPPHRVHVDGGLTVTARHVVVATQYPLLDRGAFFARLEATRSYIVAARVRGELPDGMLITAGQPTRSLRPYRDASGQAWLLVGGEGHQTGASKAEPERYERLAAFAREHFDVVDMPYRWSTQDGMPVDHLPYVGRYHPRADGLWVAGGFQKWGMTNGTVAAEILADLIAGRGSACAEHLDPNRARVRAAPKLARLNLLAGLHFFGDRLAPAEASSADDVPAGEARVVRSGLGKVGVFRDDDGALHAVSLRCTHLGCLTKWNDAERSWDCPCHGSRFDVDGTVLAGPAVDPLEPREPPR